MQNSRETRRSTLVSSASLSLSLSLSLSRSLSLALARLLARSFIAARAHFFPLHPLCLFPLTFRYRVGG